MTKENIVVSKPNKSPVLYRHFNKIGELLYIGISMSSMHRLGEHSRNATWFKNIATISLEHFSTMSQAREAEKTAIWFEKPKHNIQHNQNPKNQNPKTLAPLLQGPLIPEDYIPDNMKGTHLRLIHVMEYTTLSKSLITKIIEHDGFPAGKFTGNYALWSIAEIDAWLDTKTVNYPCKK